MSSVYVRLEADGGRLRPALTHQLQRWYPPSMLANLSTALSAAAQRDRGIFAKIAAGDEGALRQLYTQTSSRAMAIALRILRRESEAEEVVQDVYMQIWREATRFDAKRGSAIAWVSTIARTRSIDRLRSRGTADRTAQAAAADVSSSPNAPATPLEEASARADRERILAALGQLPDEQKSCIEMAYFGGLTQREIAEQTGQPLGTVKSRIRLGVDRLGQLLENDTEVAK